jgi:dsRNA-specific ribonuclease
MENLASSSNTTKHTLALRIIQEYPLVNYLLNDKFKLAKLIAIFILKSLQFSFINTSLISNSVTPCYHFLKNVKNFIIGNHGTENGIYRRYVLYIINCIKYILANFKSMKIFDMVMDIGMLRYSRPLKQCNSVSHYNTSINWGNCKSIKNFKNKSKGWKLDTWTNPKFQRNNFKINMPKKTNSQADIYPEQLCTYTVKLTNTKINLSLAPSILDKYINSLSRKRYSPEKLVKSVSLYHDLYQGTINFPRDCPIKQIIGDASRSKKLAMQRACLKSIIELHKLNALDNYLNPVYSQISSEISSELSEDINKESVITDFIDKSEPYIMGIPNLFKKEIILDENNEYFMNIIDLSYLNNIDCDIIPKLGFITSSPLSEDLNLNIYFQGKETQVSIKQVGNSFSMSVKKIKMGITFTKELLKHSLPSYFNIKSLMLKFLILPLNTYITSNYINWEAVYEFLKIALENDEEKFAVNAVIRDKLNCRSVNFVKSLLNNIDINSFIPYQETGITFRDYFDTKFKLDKKLNNVQIVLKVGKINRVENYLTPKSSVKDVHFSDESVEYSLSQFSKVICHNSQYYKTSQILTSVIYCVHHLALSSEVKQILNEPKIDIQQLSVAFTEKNAKMPYSNQKLSYLGETFLKFGSTLSVFINNPGILESELHLRRNYILQNSIILETEKKLELPTYLNKTPLLNENDSLQLILNDTRNKSYCSQIQYFKDKSLVQNAKAIIGACIMSKEVGKEELAFNVMTTIVYPMAHNWKNLINNYKSDIIETNIDHLSSNINYIESIISYTFNNKYLLIEALTHNSYSDKITACYERLEFLGDAILEYLVLFYLYKNYPNIDPRDLSELKSKCSSNSTLFEVCTQAGLDKYIFVSNIRKCGFFDSYEVLSIRKNQCKLKDTKIPSDIIESLTAAIFIDSHFNMDALGDFFDKLVVPIMNKLIHAHKSTFLLQKQEIL